MTSVRLLLVFSLATAACSSGHDEPSASSDRDAYEEEAAPDANEEEAAPQMLSEVPVPDGGYPECFGKVIAEAGLCCENLYCYTPESGPCTTDLSAVFWHFAAISSETCQCGTTTGPYASPPHTDAGSCCYVVGAQACF
jgi:hypothetical protein